MQILNIGPLELLLFIIIILVVLGPEDMVKTARSIGKFIYRITHSPIWKDIMETTQEIRDLPKKIVSDTGLEETFADINQTTTQVAQELNQSTSEIQKSSEVKVEVPVTPVTNQPVQPPVSLETPVNSGETKNNALETPSVTPTEEIIHPSDLSQLPTQQVSDNSQIETTIEGEDPHSIIPETGALSETTANIPENEETGQTSVYGDEAVTIPVEPNPTVLNQPTSSDIKTDPLLESSQNYTTVVPGNTIVGTTSDQVVEESTGSEETSVSSEVDPLIENS
jgi:sec-independent protein translocase protein TatB